LTWQFVIAGALVGVLVGMTGMGGGSLMTPMLILLFGFDPKTAVGTDILHGAVFKSFGAVRHRQLGNVHVPLALWMLVGSAPLSLVGVQIASSFSDATESTMSRVVGGALIVGGVGFAAKMFIRGHAIDADLHLDRRQKTIAITIGAICGFVVGLTSVGSGTFFGLAMLLLYPLAAPRIVGSHLSVRVPERALRTAFAFVLILSGIKLVGLPAATTIIEVSLAAGGVALLVWLAVQLRLRRLAPTAD
jgi:uncharacterized membrane protein YfcA